MKYTVDMDEAVLDGLQYARYMLYFLGGLFLLLDFPIFPESRIFGIILLVIGTVIAAFSYGAKKGNDE